MRRVLIIVLALVVAGCAANTAGPEASNDGGSTAVESLGQAPEQRKQKRAERCPLGSRRWCSTVSGYERCNCVTDWGYKERSRSMTRF